MLIFGRRQLRLVLAEYADHDNVHRPHRAWDRCHQSGLANQLVKDGRDIEPALRREGLRKADIEVVLRQQSANGPQEVAEATLTPGGAIIAWLKPQEMGARRADIDALRCRVDEL